MIDVTVLGVFFAGMISFVSPCVLPLVPSYLAYLAGVSVEEYASHERGRGAALAIIGASVAFVLGFTTLFVLLGASATSLGLLLRQYSGELTILAGIIITVMGLHFLGVFRIGFLYREARLEMKRKPPGAIGAYVMGVAFAMGWTPCIGPVLTVILPLAAAKETVIEGAMLLTVYSLGLGIPFLVAAAFAPAFMTFMNRFRTHLHRVEQIMGILLVLTGLAFIGGYMSVVAFWLAELVPQLNEFG